ncbi:MAG: site-2 protease family protein [Bacilli bacterium]
MLLFIILIHESGHLLVALLFKFKIDKVLIYPFGGITKYNEIININIFKELLVLVAGPLFQVILTIIIYNINKYGLINENTYNIFSIINRELFIFNLLPIVPLDGSKLLSIVLQLLLPYKLSLYIIIYISIIASTITVLFSPYIIIKVCALLLCKNIYQEYKDINYKFNKFLLERNLYNLGKVYINKSINNINRVRRCFKYNIIYNNMLYSEKDYLKYVYFKT